MSGARFIAFLTFAMCALPTLGFAQDAASEPILRATLDPPRVVVGQKVTLHLDILVPNYMTSPPDIPDFQIKNAITRRAKDLNLVETHEGTTFAGVRAEFEIYPQEPGTYAAEDQRVTLKYAAEPPKVRELTLAIPDVKFSAFIPSDAAQLDPFVAATALTLRQDVHRSAGSLKVGDSITRTITATAENSPSMLLPPADLVAIDGMDIYRAQPTLTENVDQRTGTLTASRVDAATYIIKKSGDYVLPAIDLRWWDLANNRNAVAHVDGVALHVVENPDIAATASPSARERSWRHLVDEVSRWWPLLLVGLAALPFLATTAQSVSRRIVRLYSERRDAYLVSEANAFVHLILAALSRDTRRTYFALLNWCSRFDPIAPAHTIHCLKQAAKSPRLTHAIGAIEATLFNPDTEPVSWSAIPFVVSLVAARRRLKQETRTVHRLRPLPDQMNPEGGNSRLSAVGPVVAR